MAARAMRKIFEEFRRSLKLIDVEELADLYLTRPLAFLLVKAIRRTEITPNQLTMISMAVGVLGGVAYGLGRPWSIVLGAVGLALSMVFDCADGQLARLKKNGTPLGRILDGVIDYVVMIAAYVGLAVGLDPGPGRRTVWLLLMAAAGASNIFHSGILDYYRVRYLERVQGEHNDIDSEIREFQGELDKMKNEPRGGLKRGIVRIYLGYLGNQKRLTPTRPSPRPLSPEERTEFARHNKGVMRGWTFLGSGTFGVLMVVTTLIGRFDLYLWGRIVAGNLLAVILFAVQARIDRAAERAPAS